MNQRADCNDCCSFIENCSDICPKLVGKDNFFDLGEDENAVIFGAHPPVTNPIWEAPPVSTYVSQNKWSMVILLFVSHTGEQPKWFDNMVKSIPTQLWLLSTTAFWSICLAFEILVIQYHITQDWHYWGNRRGSFWCFGSCSDYEWLGLVALRTKILDLMSKFKVKYNCWIRSRPLGGYSGQCHNQFYFEQIHIRFLSPAVSSNCKSL